MFYLLQLWRWQQTDVEDHHHHEAEVDPQHMKEIHRKYYQSTPEIMCSIAYDQGQQIRQPNSVTLGNRPSLIKATGILLHVIVSHHCVPEKRPLIQCHCFKIIKNKWNTVNRTYFVWFRGVSSFIRYLWIHLLNNGILTFIIGWGHFLGQN